MERLKDFLGLLLVAAFGLWVAFCVGKLILEPIAPLCSLLFVVIGTGLAFERGSGFGGLAVLGVALYVASWFVLPPGYVAETWATATRSGPHVFRWDIIPSLACTLVGFLIWGCAVGAERVATAAGVGLAGPLVLLFLPLSRVR